MALTGSPGSMLVSSATNSVTQNSTTTRCTPWRRTARTSPCPPPLLLDPHVGHRVAYGQAGERLGTARPLTQHPVDVGRSGHHPGRVVVPQVVDLFAEALVQVLVDPDPGVLVGRGAAFLQQAVDVGVLDAAEVRRVGR